MHSVVRAPALLLPALVFPLFFYMAFAGGLSAVGNLPGFDYYDYNAFQFVFVLLQSAAFGGVFIGFSIGADFDSGFTRRLFLAAGDRSAVIAGFGVAALVRAVFVWAMVFAIALATGMKVGGNGVDLLGLLALAVVVNVAAFLFAAGMMTRFRTLQAAPAMQIPVFMILMTAPVYVPRDLIQGWVATATKVNPVHGDHRVRPQPDGGRPVPRPARVRVRRRAGRAPVGLRAPRPAQGGGGRLTPRGLGRL